MQPAARQAARASDGARGGETHRLRTRRVPPPAPRPRRTAARSRFPVSRPGSAAAVRARARRTGELGRHRPAPSATAAGLHGGRGSERRAWLASGTPPPPACSSGPRMALRCGKRPKRAITSWWRAAASSHSGSPKRAHQRDAALLVGEVLAVLERQIEEEAAARPAAPGRGRRRWRRRGDLAGRGVAGEGARACRARCCAGTGRAAGTGPAPRRRRRPSREPPRGGLLDQRHEPARDLGVEARIGREPALSCRRREPEGSTHHVTRAPSDALARPGAAAMRWRAPSSAP